MWLFYERVRAEIPMVRSRWSFLSARLKRKLSTWTWGFPCRKYIAIVRFKMALSKITIVIIKWLCKALYSLRFNFRLVESNAEVYGGFPFEFEKIFKVAIGFEKKGVRVSVNGNFFCEYPTKARLSLFSGLKIREKNDLNLCVLEIHHFKVNKELNHLDSFSRLWILIWNLS